jgi:hypothetical protein
MGGARHLAHLQFHQALGGEADHLTQEGRVGALLQHPPKGDLVVGHRGRSKVRGCSSQQPNPTESPVKNALSAPGELR